MKTAENLLWQKSREIISVPPHTSIKEVCGILAAHKIGTMLVMQGRKVTGIWTERDLVRNITDPGFDPSAAKVGDYMTTGLKYVRHTDPIYILMDRYIGLRIRHLLVEKKGEFIGILSMGDVVKAVLREKFLELKEQNSKISWEYYEEWKWKPGP